MYQVRRYRNWVEDKNLVSFQVKIEESDLFIRADRILAQEAQDSLNRYRKQIQDYIQKHPEFAKSLEPYSVDEQAPDIIRRMAEACSCAGVGPMAAVAAAIAEYVGRDLLKVSPELIIENGGDIFLKTKRIRRIGIFAGKSPYTGRLALEIAPQKNCLGICTSSGTVGPSLSFGKADAAVVISQSAISADAWATRLGNEVKSADDVEKTLALVKEQIEVKGAMIIIGDKIGVWGDLKLIK